MVKGKINKYLTPEFILSHISEYDIYRYYTQHDFKLNRQFKSPFRRDDNPSFMIGSKLGRLYHIDFAQDELRGGCIDFVRQLRGVSFPDALEEIARDFGLTSGGINVNKRVAPVYTQPKKIAPIDTIIQVKPKKFTVEELRYWNDYTIDIADLKRENIYSIEKLWINKKRQIIPKGEVAFGYLYEDKYWKIYRPHAKEKKDKWRSNCPIDLVDGLDNINNCDKSIVTKAKKDKIILQKIMSCTCAVQNESVVALNEHTVKHLKTNSKVVYLNYDNDSPGKSNSWKVTQAFGFKHLNLPDYYLKIGLTDYSDLVKKLGTQAVIDHLKLKKII